MAIKMIETVCGPGQVLAAGSIVELDDEMEKHHLGTKKAKRPSKAELAKHTADRNAYRKATREAEAMRARAGRPDGDKGGSSNNEG